MSNENAILGKGADFQGKLTFEGTVRIDGRFTGEIFSDGTLIIGADAVVQAEIRVGYVAVEGTVTGNITATDGVELRAPAQLRGNITSPALHIDKGVFFDGSCQMTSGNGASERMTTPSPRQTAPRPVGVAAVTPAPAPVVGLGAPATVRDSQPVPRPATGMFVPEATRQTGELKHNF